MKTFEDVLADSRKEPTIFYTLRPASKFVRIHDSFTIWKDKNVRRKAEQTERAMVFFWFRKQPQDYIVLNGVIIAQRVTDLQAELAAMRTRQQTGNVVNL